MTRKIDETAWDAAAALHEGAAAALGAGRKNAEPLARRALGALERVLGRHHPDVANALHTLAGCATARGAHEEASELLGRALVIVDRHRRHPVLAELRLAVLQELVDVRTHQGRYLEAMTLGRRALRLAERSGDDLAVANAANALGVACKFAGRFAAASRAYARALALYQSLGLADGTHGASLFHNLGGLLHARGRSVEGEPYSRRSVALRERALGPRHPLVAADLCALGALVESQQRHAEAEQIFRRAWRIQRRALGPDHPEHVVLLSNLAAARHHLGDDDEAETLLSEALRVQRVCDPRHPEMALVLQNLAVIAAGRGRRAEARRLLQRAERVAARQLPARHLRRLEIREELRRLSDS